MTSNEIAFVMRQALEALNTPRPSDSYPPLWKAYAETINNAIASLRQTIARAEGTLEAEPSRSDMKQTSVSEVEPVAKVCHDLDQHIGWNPNAKVNEFLEGMPLYTSPPQRQWVGLTDEEHMILYTKADGGLHDWAKAIEAKLKAKNSL